MTEPEDVDAVEPVDRLLALRKAVLEGGEGRLEGTGTVLGTLDGAVANDYLTSALRTVRTHLVRVRRLARDNPDRLAASVAEHRLIASAIARRDADLAAHATHIHLHNALTSILDSLEAPSEAVPSRPSGRGTTNDREQGAA